MDFWTGRIAIKSWRLWTMVLALLLAVPATANDINELTLRGNQDYRDGRLNQAVAVYSEALKLAPNNVKALNNRGLAFEANGQLKDALVDLSRAVELAPENGAIWNNRANTNCKLKRVRQSVADRMQALYTGRFTVGQAQSGLRRSGFYRGPSDGIWGYDADDALLDWTEAGCPDPPASRLLF